MAQLDDDKAKILAHERSLRDMGDAGVFEAADFSKALRIPLERAKRATRALVREGLVVG